MSLWVMSIPESKTTIFTGGPRRLLTSGCTSFLNLISQVSALDEDSLEESLNSASSRSPMIRDCGLACKDWDCAGTTCYYVNLTGPK